MTYVVVAAVGGGVAVWDSETHALVENARIIRDYFVPEGGNIAVNLRRVVDFEVNGKQHLGVPVTRLS